MTWSWFNQHIIAEPSSQLLSLLACHPALAGGLYWLRDLTQPSEQPKPASLDLPPGGLVVVQPVGDPQLFVSTTPLISWHTVSGPPELTIHLTPTLIASQVPDFHPEFYPPLSFLQFLKATSLRAGVTVGYHFCAYTAEGYPDIEYHWLFSPEEMVYAAGQSFYQSPSIDQAVSQPRSTTFRQAIMEAYRGYAAWLMDEFAWEDYRVDPSSVV